MAGAGRAAKLRLVQQSGNLVSLQGVSPAASVSVVDMSGRSWPVSRLSGGADVATATLPAGLYAFVVVEAGQGVEAVRFVVR